MAWAASPVTQTDVLQLLKSVVAAVLAWVVAEMVLGLEQAFLAPWVALLTVHATVYRTMWRGAQTVLSVGAGVLLSLAVVETLNVTPFSFALALAAGLALARVKVLRDEGITIATTALFVMTTGYNFSEQHAIALLPARLLDTGIGVAIALVVNLAVLPPLNDHSARAQIDDVDRKLGALLTDMATQMRSPQQAAQEEDWIERTRAIDEDLHHAWSLVREAQESGSFNPRRRLHPGAEIESYPDVLRRLEEGVAQTRNIARLVRDSIGAAQQWEPIFRDRFLDLLESVGHRVADPDADVAELREGLKSLAHELSNENLSSMLWPLYGALIAGLQIIVDVVDDVATAEPVRTSGVTGPRHV